MNEHNHHRIIEKFANKVGIGNTKVLEKASDFTDSINAEGNYFFYHFYYDIIIEGDTIQLNRINETWHNDSSNSMKRCGDKTISKNPNRRGQVSSVSVNYNLGKWSSSTNEKEFFAWINNRKKSPKHKLLDTGNQSDNVSFLHAMGAEDESLDDSRKEFENHLRKCFFFGSEQHNLCPPSYLDKGANC